MANNFISYADLQAEGNGFSKLFVDYIYNFDRVKDFYSSNFRDKNNLRSKIESILKRKIDRSTLVKVLSNQNRDFQCGVKTLSNIDLLLNDNTVAIITGQQVGLFGGPLYTLYKTITAIDLANKLSKEFPEYNFVPIFWIEGEDHDLEEVSKFTFLNSKNEITFLQNPISEIKPFKNCGAVGNIEFDESIENVFTQLKQLLTNTEFTPQILNIFANAYQKGMTFTKSFVHLYNILLENSGLVFFNPHNTETKILLKDIFAKEINAFPKTCQLVIEQSDIIEKNYHAQVKPRPINLFLFYNGGRYAIEPHADGFSLKGIRKIFSKEELLNLLQNDPNAFSPNVVLRPICQDFLFPTLSYVAGPSEVAYLAQFKTLYDYFDIIQPIIYPRASITILEERINKVGDKYNLSIKDYFEDIELIKNRVANNLSDFKVEELFSNTYGTVSESITSLKDGIEKIDVTLVNALENTLTKMQNALNSLKDKTIEAQKRQHEISLRQLDKVSLTIRPNNNLQEREINIIYFLNKYGLDFIGWLRNQIDIEKFSHQIIHIE